MDSEIIGISGSPVKNSNTDRLIQSMLDAARLESKFVKLSSINVKPCFACKKCVRDNICKTGDDFPELAEKIKKAKALIIGAYVPYGQIDGFTKALLERFWSLRHVNNLLRGKLCATVLTGIDADRLETVNKALGAQVEKYEHMELVGQLTVRGNIPCITCGEGDDCEMSGMRRRYGPEARTCDFPYLRVEDQKETWEEAIRIGRLIGERVRGK